MTNAAAVAKIAAFNPGTPDARIAEAIRIADDPTPAENIALTAYATWRMAAASSTNVALGHLTYRTFSLAVTAAGGDDGAIWLAAAALWNPDDPNVQL